MRPDRETNLVLEPSRGTSLHSSLLLFILIGALFLCASNAFIYILTVRAFWVKPVNALHTHTHMSGATRDTSHSCRSQTHGQRRSGLEELIRIQDPLEVRAQQ